MSSWFYASGTGHDLQEDSTDKQQDNEEVQLRIAWQYRRYIKSKQKAAASAASSRYAEHDMIKPLLLSAPQS